jgi:hypothetical protein
MSLQIPSRSGYFSMLIRRCVVWAVVVAGSGLGAGCGERDRLTFPEENPPGDGVGPHTTITRPEVGDTVLTEGEPFVLAGMSDDPDGIDLVEFDVAGAGVSYAPLDGGGADTVRFEIQLPTFGHAGDTITVRIFAIDLEGTSGGASVRQLRVE